MPGRPGLVRVMAWPSLPKARSSTARAAPETVAWADAKLGNGGVAINGSQVGSGVVLLLPSRSPFQIAVTGRHRLSEYLVSNTAIEPSAMAIASRAKVREFSESVLP